MRVAASLREWLSGNAWLLDRPRDERAMEVRLELHSPPSGCSGPWTLEGAIDVDGLARRRPLTGTLNWERTPHRIDYRFAFAGDDGSPYVFRGHKVWTPRAPAESLTLLRGALFDGGDVERAGVTLRFDARADWKRWLRAVRISLESA
jgi:hypothetical protein